MTTRKTTPPRPRSGRRRSIHPSTIPNEDGLVTPARRPGRTPSGHPGA